MPRVPLAGLGFDAVTADDVVAQVRRALDRGRGGRIVTPNIDILRQAARSRRIRETLNAADLVVADGAPLLWATRLAGTPLPERVAGSDLIWSLSRGLARDGRSIYLLGGEPSRAGVPEGAQRAAGILALACPGLRIAGHASPRYGFDTRRRELAAICREVIEAKPDLVYVGIGFPRQERLIDLIRPELPGAWFLGCGAAINFVAGDQQRAGGLLQRIGLEWAHRLASEPRRLAKRYLRHDAPFAVRLLLLAALLRRAPAYGSPPQYLSSGQYIIRRRRAPG